MKKTGSRDRLGITLLSAGCFFLLDPFLGAFELFPDFVGAVLFLLGSRRLALLDRRIESFRRKAAAFFWLSLARVAVAVGTALPALFGTGTDFLSGLDTILDPTMRLTFSFSFAVLDCILLIPGFFSLFEGLEYVYLRNLLEETETDAAISVPRSVRTVTVIFLLARSFLGFAPMLSALHSEYGTVGDAAVPFETLYAVLAVLCFLLAFAVGIVWFSSVRPYFAFFSRDEEWESAMAERLEREIYSSGYQMNRLNAAFLCSTLTASSVLLLSVPISSRYLLPEFLFGILAVWAAWKICLPADRKTLRSSGIGFAVSALLCYVLSFVYSERCGVWFDPTLRKGFWGLYIPAAVFWIVSSVFLALLFYRLYRAVCTFVCGAVGVCSGTGSDTRREADSRLKRELCRKVKRLWTFQCLFTVLRAAAFIASPWAGLSWVAPFVVALAVIFYTYWVTKEIAEETEMAI